MTTQAESRRRGRDLASADPDVLRRELKAAERAQRRGAAPIGTVSSTSRRYVIDPVEYTEEDEEML